MGRSEGHEGVTIGEGECVRETDRAILVELRGPKDSFGGRTVTEKWIPKSVIHDDSEVFEADTEGSVIVHRWWAEKEGIE
jgi:hypothetical protein